MHEPPGAEPCDEAALVRLASDPATAPGTLRTLAAAVSPVVRASVAMNLAAPEAADHLLATDGQEPVRTLLARKLAMLAPQLSRGECRRLLAQTYRTLMQLVTDEAARVRATIAEIVREMPQAPYELILALAHDTEFAVAGPVIALSPLLGAADLLGLLGRPQAAVAVAGRDGLDGTVAEAIARSDNAAAITALLENHSAVVREATLDVLVQRATAQPGWHAPLVRRPSLSGRAVRALSAIVTTQLLGELARRGDLDPACRDDLRRRLAQREAAQGPFPSESSPSKSSLGEAMAAARGAHGRGQLDEATVLAALVRGDAATATAMLAVRADLAAATVERAAGLRSAKGLVSIAWAGGFSMRVAEAAQLALGRLSAALSLHADADDGFPLSPSEMRWQIELLSHTAETTDVSDTNVSELQPTHD